MTLIQAGNTWQFGTEAGLEEVIWHNLPELLSLKPVNRQFSIDGKFCDILAIEPSDRLVIIELKNTEDRYVVQQLTRYYHAIKTAETLPFSTNIDDPRLLVIAPSFHTDTLIDCQYSTLNVELITFSLEAASDNINLVLRDASGNVLSTLHLLKALHHTQPQISVSEPPRKLLNWLSAVQEPEYTWILELRKQLLNADARCEKGSKQTVSSTRRANQSLAANSERLGRQNIEGKESTVIYGYPTQKIIRTLLRCG